MFENLLNNLNLKWKIVLITLLFIILIMFVVAFFIYNSTTNIVLKQINDKINIMSNYQVDLLTKITNDLESELERLSENVMIKIYTEIVYNRNNHQENRKYTRQWSFEELIYYLSYIPTGELKQLTQDNESISVSYITNPDGVVIADSRYDITLDKLEYMGKKLEPERYKDLQFGKLAYINNEPLTLMNKEIRNENGIVGYLVIGLSLDLFRKNLKTYFSNLGSVYLINREGRILNSQNKDNIGKRIGNEWFLQQIDKEEKENREIIKDKLLLLNKMEGLEIFLAGSFPFDKINLPSIKIKNAIMYMSFIGIILMAITIILVLNSQLRPLHFLLEKMNKVRKGDLDVKVNIKRNDEIGKLALNFNKMVIDIKELLNEVKNDQEEIRQYELKALQSQINPHFLYNTLDSIYWMTKTKEYDEIGEMTVALSQFFRLSLNKGRDITNIKKEIEHVKNYLVIQKLRYPDKFECKINVDPDIYQNECIKLILQPLVENSLLHGLERKKSDGIIEITGKKEKNYVLLKVCDNGKGFDPEEMKYLIKEDSRNKGGYALRNVNSRIKLNYGEGHGLAFYESETGGACVEIKLPVKKYKGDQDVQDDNS